MCAALMWTVIDFLAYGDLSGWSTKGKYACPSCHKDTQSCYLKHSRKECFIDQQRFLDFNHCYCHDEKHFDNALEWRRAPKSLFGNNLLE